MSYRSRAILLVAIQFCLVASLAAKYAYERATRPRVWTVVGQFDPNLPMRGRYLALTPLVDACSLKRDAAPGPRIHMLDGPPMNAVDAYWQVRIEARDGRLVAVDATRLLPRSETENVWVRAGQPCARAQMSPPILFFISDTAKSPLPLQKGQELWAEVTVPAAGPPRPIQLAIRDNGAWKPLHFN